MNEQSLFAMEFELKL